MEIHNSSLVIIPCHSPLNVCGQRKVIKHLLATENNILVAYVTENMVNVEN